MRLARCSPSPASIRSARNWLQHWRTGSVRLHRQTDTTHITISPSLSTSTSAPNATISALPSNGTAITFVGLASTGYAQSLVYHKDAFALACADLIMPQGVHFAGRKNQDGFSIRVVRQYDINNDLLPMRIDMLYGWKTIRPEWACRVTS